VIEFTVWHEAANCFGTALAFDGYNYKNMTPVVPRILKSVFSIFLLAVTLNCTSASAQNVAAKSRVAVVTNDVKTNIWISDFPKNTSVIVYDSEDNLLSILSTNDFGSAYLSLPKSVKTGVIVKTIDGEITATNKSVIKNKPEEQNVVTTYQEESNKA
jgi:uncharacterized UPF0146 family protein